MKNKHLKNFYIFLVLLFLFLPIFILVVYSFNSSRLNVTFENFTFDWYLSLMDNVSLLEAFKNTLLIAFVSTTVSVIIGTMGAIAMHRYQFKTKKALDTLLYIPIVIPEIVLGISLLSIFTLTNIELSLITITLAHITFCVPFVVLCVRSTLSSYDDQIELAAMALGANKFKTLFYITIPSLLPGIASGALLAFSLSLDDVIISYFTAGPGSNTLPLKIFSMIKMGITPEVNALTTIILLFTIIALSLFIIIQIKKNKKG